MRIFPRIGAGGGSSRYADRDDQRNQPPTGRPLLRREIVQAVAWRRSVLHIRYLSLRIFDGNGPIAPTLVSAGADHSELRALHTVGSVTTFTPLRGYRPDKAEDHGIYSSNQ